MSFAIVEHGFSLGGADPIPIAIGNHMLHSRKTKKIERLIVSIILNILLLT